MNQNDRMSALLAGHRGDDQRRGRKKIRDILSDVPQLRRAGMKRGRDAAEDARLSLVHPAFLKR
jgi:hypothetical protein